MPSLVADNNKRIARNTLFMYIRLLLVMLVSLFTVRVVLNALGEVDYGVHNVVGGVVSMFSFVSTTLSGASMRFFSFQLGKKDYDALSRYFSVTFWCYVLMCIGIVFLAETVGLWFVNTKLVIPENRFYAAQWVYQFSIISTVVGLMAIPFNSLILAHEKMDLYAYVGVVEVLIKLLIAFLLFTSTSDRLILYSLLLTCSSTIVAGFYIIYNLIHFRESHVKCLWDKTIFKDVFAYSSWSMLGAISLVFRSQGINILINIFFGPIINTARAIAYQVNNAINAFVNNFSQALKPQQTKYYASGDFDNFISLTYRATRLCFFLILVLSLPVLLETDYLLKLWLGSVSEVAVLFTRLVFFVSIIEAISTPLKGLISSTGNIKYNQVINSAILIAIFPVSWILFKIGMPAAATMVVAIIASFLCHIVRIVISCRLTIMTFSSYLKYAIVPIIKVSMVSIPLPLLSHFMINNSLLRLLITTIVAVSCVFTSVWFLGFTKGERDALLNLLKTKLSLKGNSTND